MLMWNHCFRIIRWVFPAESELDDQRSGDRKAQRYKAQLCSMYSNHQNDRNKYSLALFCVSTASRPCSWCPPCLSQRECQRKCQTECQNGGQKKCQNRWDVRNYDIVMSGWGSLEVKHFVGGRGHQCLDTILKFVGKICGNFRMKPNTIHRTALSDLSDWIRVGRSNMSLHISF